MGATPTLPPHRQPPPISRNQRTRRPGPDAHQDDLVLGVDVDQPTTSHATPAAELERDRDIDLALEQAAVRAHRELAQTDPTIRTAGEPEPLGRLLPQPLDAGREGVER